VESSPQVAGLLVIELTIVTLVRDLTRLISLINEGSGLRFLDLLEVTTVIVPVSQVVDVPAMELAIVTFVRELTRLISLVSDGSGLGFLDLLEVTTVIVPVSQVVDVPAMELTIVLTAFVHEGAIFFLLVN
jgi:uncharacterized membrane protein